MLYTTKRTVDVLVYDTSDPSVRIIREACEINQWSFEVCSNLEIAVKTLVTIEPKVIIVEVFSREKDIELLRALKRLKSHSIIIKYTDTVKDHFFYEKRFGLIYDFVLKSASIEIISDTIRKAIQYHDYKNSKLSMTENTVSGIKNELEWMIWKEQKLIDSQKIMGKTIIESIVHSIFQGMGFGNLVAITDLLELGKVDEGEYVKVKSDLFHSLLENVAPIQIMKEKLDRMIGILEYEPIAEKVAATELEEILGQAIQDVEFLRSIKGQTIQSGIANLPEFIKSDREFLKIAFTEILTNAFKYSPDNSIIYISSYKTEHEFFLVFYNDILETDSSLAGIPPEMEFEIFEPFFKISNIYDERFYQEELGFGIGLTVVHDFSKKLGGNIHLQNVMDYVSDPPRLKVKAEMAFLLLH